MIKFVESLLLMLYSLWFVAKEISRWWFNSPCRYPGDSQDAYEFRLLPVSWLGMGVESHETVVKSCLVGGLEHEFYDLPFSWE